MAFEGDGGIGSSFSAFFRKVILMTVIGAAVAPVLIYKFLPSSYYSFIYPLFHQQLPLRSKVAYLPPGCSREKPLEITVRNMSDRAVMVHSFAFDALADGVPEPVVQVSPDVYQLDARIAPRQEYRKCWAISKKIGSADLVHLLERDPTKLIWRTGFTMWEFLPDTPANGQPKAAHS